MSQAVHQLRSVSSFKNVGHCPEPTLEGLLGNAGLYPNADPGTHHAPMGAATGFANTTSTHILGPQTTTGLASVSLETNSHDGGSGPSPNRGTYVLMRRTPSGVSTKRLSGSRRGITGRRSMCYTCWPLRFYSQ